MKKICFSLSFSLLITMGAFAQTWTEAQRSAANTAKDITYLSTAEKEAILYLNLARLYPKQFAKTEVAPYTGTDEYPDYLLESPYKSSLLKYLDSIPASKALTFDSTMYASAKCFAEESGNAGTTGHARRICVDDNFAECCSYGMYSGKDIIMQLLVDYEVPSLGHRKLCLSNSYTQIGVATHSHTVWGTCAVMELY
jgi:hypothetical protein